MQNTERNLKLYHDSVTNGKEVRARTAPSKDESRTERHVSDYHLTDDNSLAYFHPFWKANCTPITKLVDNPRQSPTTSQIKPKGKAQPKIENANRNKI